MKELIEYIILGKEGDTSSCIPQSVRMLIHNKFVHEWKASYENVKHQKSSSMTLLKICDLKTIELFKTQIYKKKTFVNSFLPLS
jgi:hypothetical protein